MYTNLRDWSREMFPSQKSRENTSQITVGLHPDMCVCFKTKLAKDNKKQTDFIVQCIKDFLNDDGAKIGRQTVMPYPQKQVYLNVSPTDHAALKEKCQQLQRPFSDVVREYITAYLNEEANE